MNYFESINLNEMTFYAIVRTFYIDPCIVFVSSKYHKDVKNLEEVETRYKDLSRRKVENRVPNFLELETQMEKEGRYSPGFTKGTNLSTMHTRPNAKSSTESLRRLRKGVRLSLEQGNRRAEDENVVLKTKFSKLNSQTVLRIKE
ncbi:hypothetical protein MKW92_015531 [Papaver armeniacum]|nr:hypothetical protein MKW92_015531 [Papaver armeniacum]